MSIRLPALTLGLAASLALACSEEAKPPAADSAAPSASADAPITTSATATPAVKAGAPDGSPFSVTHHVEGDGASPTPSDEVRVNYEGRLADGSVFDSSYARNEPITFPLGGVIPCWTQGVSQMKVGGKATLVCPPEMAYGSSGTGPIPPNATLTFDVELLGIEAAPTSPQ